MKNRMMDVMIYLVSHEASAISLTNPDLETCRNSASGRGWWQKKKVTQAEGSGGGNFNQPSAFSHTAHAKMP